MGVGKLGERTNDIEKRRGDSAARQSVRTGNMMGAAARPNPFVLKEKRKKGKVLHSDQGLEGFRFVTLEQK